MYYSYLNIKQSYIFRKKNRGHGKTDGVIVICRSLIVGRYDT